MRGALRGMVVVPPPSLRSENQQKENEWERETLSHLTFLVWTCGLPVHRQYVEWLILQRSKCPLRQVQRDGRGRGGMNTWSRRSGKGENSAGGDPLPPPSGEVGASLPPSCWQVSSGEDNDEGAFTERFSLSSSASLSSASSLDMSPFSSASFSATPYGSADAAPVVMNDRNEDSMSDSLLRRLAAQRGRRQDAVGQAQRLLRLTAERCRCLSDTLRRIVSRPEERTPILEGTPPSRKRDEISVPVFLQCTLAASSSRADGADDEEGCLGNDNDNGYHHRHHYHQQEENKRHDTAASPTAGNLSCQLAEKVVVVVVVPHSMVQNIDDAVAHSRSGPLFFGNTLSTTTTTTIDVLTLYDPTTELSNKGTWMAEDQQQQRGRQESLIRKRRRTEGQQGEEGDWLSDRPRCDDDHMNAPHIPSSTSIIPTAHSPSATWREEMLRRSMELFEATQKAVTDAHAPVEDSHHDHSNNNNNNEEEEADEGGGYAADEDGKELEIPAPRLLPRRVAMQCAAITQRAQLESPAAAARNTATSITPTPSLWEPRMPPERLSGQSLSIDSRRLDTVVGLLGKEVEGVNGARNSAQGQAVDVVLVDDGERERRKEGHRKGEKDPSEELHRRPWTVGVEVESKIRGLKDGTTRTRHTTTNNAIKGTLPRSSNAVVIIVSDSDEEEIEV